VINDDIVLKALTNTNGADEKNPTVSRENPEILYLPATIAQERPDDPLSRCEERVVALSREVAHKGPFQQIVDILLELVSYVPPSDEAESHTPESTSRAIMSRAAKSAAFVSGSLSLPPGPLGLLTVLPDLIAIWQIQRQMVSDIAGAYGKQAQLTREQMIYCLFRHAASQAMRDIVARVGERILVREASMKVIQGTMRRVGIRVTEELAGRVVSRWIPIVGAIGVGAYAYYDTRQVARNAIRLFECELSVEPKPTQ
jgi:hypothetical protein